MGVLDYVAKLRVFGNNTRGKNVSKGSKRRPENSKNFQKGYDKVFGKHTLNAIKGMKNYNNRRANNGR
jgi:hypothetical protein